MSRRGQEEEATRRTREVAGRAIRRLEFLEWALLLGAVVVALGGGALLAALLAAPLGVSFRLLWVASSVVILVVPGGFALHGARREERAGKNLHKADDADV